MRPIRTSRDRGTMRSSSLPRRRTAVTPIALPSGEATTPPVQDAIDQLMADEPPRRDHRADERPGVADQRRSEPDGDLNGHFEYFVGSSTAAAVSGYADITVPAGYDAGLPIGITFIGGSLGRTEAARPRLRLRAGDAGPCPAAVHPDDRRRAVPRRPEPAGSDAGAAAAGDAGSTRSLVRMR